MRPHDRVRDVRRFRELRRSQLRARAVVDAAAHRIAVDRPGPGEAALHGLRQGLIGGHAIREDGVAERLAAAVRHLLRVEQRAAARVFAVRGVAVPSKAGVRQPDMLARLVLDVRDQQDFGKTGQQVFLDDVDLEFAEAAAERDVLLFGQPLIAEKYDDVVVKDPLDLAKGPVVERLRQIENDLRTQGGVGLSHRDRHGRGRWVRAGQPIPCGKGIGGSSLSIHLG